MSSFSVVIPGQPPSVNHTHKDALIQRRDGTTTRKRIKVPEAAEYIKNVWGSVLEARPRGWAPPVYLPKEGRGLIFVDIRLYLARDVDADNTAKCLMDGVKLALGIDDDQLLPRYQHKIVGVEKPRVELVVLA